MAKKHPEKKIEITPTDFMAFFIVVAGFALIAFGVDGEVKALVGMAAGYYLRGRVNSRR